MKSQQKTGKAASQAISQRIAELGDWRGETLAKVRALIKEADPDVVEEWKWMGTPIWAHEGLICTGESYKAVVKLTFHKGASLSDPAQLFNSSREGVQGPHPRGGRAQHVSREEVHEAQVGPLAMPCGWRPSAPTTPAVGSPTQMAVLTR
jgi:hypothetical protein